MRLTTIFLTICVLPWPALSEDPDFASLQRSLNEAFIARDYDRAAEIVAELASLIDGERAHSARIDSQLVGAVARGNAEGVAAALSSGANPLALAPGGVPVLVRATNYADTEAALAMSAHLLQAGADPNAVDNAGLSALASVASRCHGREPVVELLLDSGADPSKGHYSGGTAFQLSAGSPHGCSHVFVRRGIDVDLASAAAVRALISGVRAGDVAAATILLDAGHDIDTVDENRDGWSLLMHAVDAGQETMVRLLLERGASESFVDAGGRSARDMAIDAGRTSIADQLKYTIQLSADIDTTSLQRKQTKK